jgi:hypothetical protein
MPHPGAEDEDAIHLAACFQPALGGLKTVKSEQLGARFLAALKASHQPAIDAIGFGSGWGSRSRL